MYICMYYSLDKNVHVHIIFCFFISAAKEYFNQALAIFERAIGDTSPEVLKVIPYIICILICSQYFSWMDNFTKFEVEYYQHIRTLTNTGLVTDVQ